jgi:hypothetical protein
VNHQFSIALLSIVPRCLLLAIEHSYNESKGIKKYLQSLSLKSTGFSNNIHKQFSSPTIITMLPANITQQQEIPYQFICIFFEFLINRLLQDDCIVYLFFLLSKFGGVGQGNDKQ